jgi:ADP-ribose pyrophosphatase YjhB (NUDIX family)
VIDRLYRWAFWCAYRVVRASRRIRPGVSHGAYVAVWSGERVLLIRNSYRSGDSLPAGGLKRGETHRDAARRELAEEVGIEVRADELEFVCEVETEGRYGRDRCQFFELRYDEDPEVRIDRREVIDWDFCPDEELPERPLLRIVRHYLNQRRTPLHPAQ